MSIDTAELKKLIAKKSAKLSKPPAHGKTNRTQTDEAEKEFKSERDKLMKEYKEIVADILFNEGLVDSRESLNVILNVMSESFIERVARNSK
jgi:hypothetical protein